MKQNRPIYHFSSVSLQNNISPSKSDVPSNTKEAQSISLPVTMKAGSFIKIVYITVFSGWNWNRKIDSRKPKN